MSYYEPTPAWLPGPRAPELICNPLSPCHPWGLFVPPISSSRSPQGRGLFRTGPASRPLAGPCSCSLKQETYLPDPLLHSGPLPKPQLRPLWSGAVSPGHDAVLRCESHVPYFTLELLRAGEVVDSTHHPSVDLVLTYVGPQHAGNYSCRARFRWPLVSELSNPVELQVAGEVPLGSESWVPLQTVPSTRSALPGACSQHIG